MKICGLSTRDAVDAVIARGASHVGFVSFEKSPRHLDLDTMAMLVEHARGRAQTVIVTVNPSDDLVDLLAQKVRPDWLQLHGKETPERSAHLTRQNRFKVMKSLAVAEAGDLAAIAAYRGQCDHILLDSKRPKGSVLPGGNGVSFDWRILSDLDPALPIMLSGGLDADNVCDAVAIAKPAGLDVSSGVESAPGIKDIGRIHSFFDALDCLVGKAPVTKRS